MSIASTAPRGARRRFMSGVALVALIVGASIAVVRLQARLAPVTLPSLASVASERPRPVAPAPRLTPAVYAPSRAASAGAEPAAAEPEWVRVMVSPELRVERVAPAQYAVVQERVLLEPERRVERVVAAPTTIVETIPARYGYRDRRVETQPARMVVDTIPAVWEWRRRSPAAPSSPSG